MDQVTHQQKLIDFANILKAFIGSIYLSMPFAFYQAGVLMGLILLLFIALINDHCCMKIVRCKSMIIERLMEQLETKKNNNLLAENEVQLLESGRLKSRLEDRMTLSHIAKYAYGKKGQWVVTFCLFLSQMGFCSNYMVFVGSTLYDMVYGSGNGSVPVNSSTLYNEYSDISLGADPELITKPRIDLIWFVVMPLPIFALFALLRSIRNMGWISVIANVTITVGCIMVIGLVFNHFSVDPTYKLVKWNTVAVVFGLLTTAFEGIGTVISIESSMTGNRHNFNKYLHATIIIIVVILGTFGVFGHLRYGDNVQQIILKNFNDSVFLTFVNVILVVSVICTYPLMMFPCTEIAEFLFFRKRSADFIREKEAAMDSVEDEEKNMHDIAENLSDNDQARPQSSDEAKKKKRRNRQINSFEPAMTTDEDNYLTDSQEDLLAELSAAESEDEDRAKAVRKRQRRYKKKMSSPETKLTSADGGGVANYGAVLEVDAEHGLANQNESQQDFVSESILTKRQERMMRIVHSNKIDAPAWKRNMIRLSIVTLQLGIAILMRNDFAYLSAFIGSLGSSVLAYMLPGAVHYKLTRQRPDPDMKPYKMYFHKFVDVFVVVFGIFGSIITLVTTILSMVTGN